MRTIWKFPVPLVDEPVIEMPKGAKALRVDVQHGEPYLWALVEDDAPKMEYYFRLVGTGRPANGLQVSNYIDTFQVAGGDLVFHLFK
jgi:hypothetical protein